jgi:hypothetical protein
MTTQTIRTFALALLLGGAGVASADNDVLKITFSTGTDAQLVSLDDIDHITFSEEALTIFTPDGSSSVISLDDIAQITFTASVTTATEPVSASLAPDVSITYGGGTARISNPKQEALTVGVYSAQGQLMRFVRAQGDVEIDFTALPQGIYIVKANNTAIKIKK